MRSNRKRTHPAIAKLCLALLIAGCASTGPTEVLTTRPEAVEPEGPLTATSSPAAATIEAIDVEQSDGAARISVATSEPLVWTTYRDADGRLVVELPNSQPADGLAGLEPADGLVSSLEVTSDTVGNRPLTRLMIATSAEADHTVSAAEGGLEVELGSAERVAALPAVEEMATAAAMEAAVEEAVEQAEADTTVWESEGVVEEEMVDDTPMVEPAMEESWAEAPLMADGPATELRNINITAVDGGVVVRIMGDGEFAYETLSLEDPDRYVIDLAGVANFAPQGMYPASGTPVERVRVAQFKSEPMPVARVVVDLAYAATPELVGLPDGLALSFGGAAAASWQADDSTLWQDVSDEPEMADAAPAEVVESAYEAEQVYEEVPASYAAEPEMVAQVEEMAVDEMAVEQEAEMETEPVVESYEPVVEEAAPMVEAYDAPAAPPIVQFAEPELPRADGELFNSQETEAGGQKVYRGEPITLRLRDADIRDLLRSFAEFSGLNFVIQPGVRGTVTVELTDVPWDQALDLILKTNDLGYELEGNILRIAPLAKLRAEAEEEQRLRKAQAEAVPLAFVIKRVSYATAGSIAAVLQGGANSVMSSRGSVMVDQRTNTLIIKELPNFIDTVIAVIETLDIPEPQVMIEARIIETTKRFSRSLGINWGFDAVASAATGNTTGLVFPNNGTVSGGVDVSQAGVGTLGITLGNVLNTFQLDVALQAAESDGLINILSAPKITTLNNEAASIQSGLQIPIQTLSNNTVSVQFVNATLQLNVTPHVTAEGTVLMDIDIQKKEPLLAFAVQGAANAPISTKDARTRVLVRDGGTTVIGGIYEVTSDEGQDRVPGLSRIPLLRNLFRNNRQSEENEELLIFITPRVVKL